MGPSLLHAFSRPQHRHRNQHNPQHSHHCHERFSTPPPHVQTSPDALGAVTAARSPSIGSSVLLPSLLVLEQMKLVPFGLAAVVCCLLACASACTAVLLALEHTASRDGAPWVDTSIVGTGVASAACALAAICFQIHRSRTPSSPKAGVLLAAAGVAAHTVMLATLSVYWSCFTFKTYYRSGSSNIGGGDPRRHIVQRQINYFEYYGRWSDEEAALYTLGCVGGVTAWLLAFVSAALDARTASKQHAGSSMPVAKCAPHAATFVVPLVPVPRELATPHHPCSRTNSGEELLSKTAALLQAEDDLQLLPGTPVQEDARAKVLST